MEKEIEMSDSKFLIRNRDDVISNLDSQILKLERLLESNVSTEDEFSKVESSVDITIRYCYTLLEQSIVNFEGIKAEITFQLPQNPSLERRFNVLKIGAQLHLKHCKAYRKEIAEGLYDKKLYHHIDWISMRLKKVIPWIYKSIQS